MHQKWEYFFQGGGGGGDLCNIVTALEPSELSANSLTSRRKEYMDMGDPI